MVGGSYKPKCAEYHNTKLSNPELETWFEDILGSNIVALPWTMVTKVARNLSKFNFV